MGKAGKWIRNLFTGGNKEKGNGKSNVSTQPSSSPLVVEIHGSNTTPAATPTPKEKKRWSFRRSTGAKEHHHQYMGSVESMGSMFGSFEAESDQQKRHALAVAVASAAGADAAVAAAQATAAVIRMKAAAHKLTAVEEAAAVKIQSAFRSCLARKALRALKGLVKLQALVRGHLVRKQATATLRCMQALVTAQARARVQRIKMSDESQLIPQRRSPQRRSPPDSRFRKSYEWDRVVDENIKIVEMDIGDGRRSSKSRYSYSPTNELDKTDHQLSADQYYGKTNIPILPKLDHPFQISPSPSALTDISPRACSGHFEEYSYATTQSSPQYFSTVAKPDPNSDETFSFPKPDYPEPMSAQMQYAFFPGYMANTESSRAKVRSQSAPKQRPEAWERQPSARRRPSMEGRNMIPRGVRMQRSSSQVGSGINNYHYPWSIKLDRSAASIKDGSECGSTSTVLSKTNYCRSLVGFEGSNGSRY